MTGILIFAEFEEGELRPEFWELVGLAGKLGGTTSVALVGWRPGPALEAARRAGASAVHLVEGERLADPWPEAHAQALAALAQELAPEVLLVPRTVLGAEVAARVAIQLGWALVQDATELEKGPGGVTAARPVFGGAVSASLSAPRGPWVVVPRPHAFPAASPRDGAPSPVVSHVAALPAQPRTHPGARARLQSAGARDIEKARVLVAGGAGLGGPEPFRLLGEIAELLDGAVAASRVAVDAGWVPASIQVGLTGKTVAPDLYLAVGISGATHHLAGCSSAQVIAVVNTDKAAPFFRLANYGVVGDWKEVLPGLRDALAEKLAAKKGAA